MILNRRSLLKTGAAAGLVSALPGVTFAGYAPRPDGWRSFELTTRVELARNGAPAQAWVPVPSMNTDWSRPGETLFTGNATRATLETDAATGLAFVHAVWDKGDEPAVLEVVSTAATTNRSVDVSATSGATLSDAERARHTAATMLLPTDGIVKDTADSILVGATSDVEKARRIYNWVVETTERNPETRGCGLGDIASMLHTGDLTGKCADLNALYVGLARAGGLPARDLYGLRVAPSAFGYKSLGAGSEVVTKAQHCRAEVFLEGIGWTPVDPADVRKVVLEEPPKTLTLASPEVEDVRDALFGASEGNWLAYNDAHDVELPGSTQGPIPFLMYPQAEIDGEPRDELDADSFAYTITVRDITA